MCFNWDNLIERALGGAIHPPPLVLEDRPSSDDPFFWKPHGCVTQAGQNWVLPQEGTVLSRAFRDQCARTKGRDRFVICMGVNDANHFGHSELEALFGASVTSFDVRPTPADSSDIGPVVSLSAKWVLLSILRALDPDFRVFSRRLQGRVPQQ